MRKFLLFGLVVVLAGCGAESPPPAAPPSSMSSSVAPSSAPTSTIKDPATYFPAEADLAPVKLKVSQAPLPYVISAHTPLVLIDMCGQSHDWDSKVRSGEQAMYAGTAPVGMGVDQLVAHFDGVSGAEVVDAMKQALRCRRITYKHLSFVVGPPLKVAVPAGAESAYGFCASIPQSSLNNCFLLLASGDKVTSLATWAYAEGWTKKDSEAMLAASAPIFAAALAKT